MSMDKKFESICKMTQNGVKKYAEKELKKTHANVYVGNGYVYAQGTFPVLLVAHMDTVHKIAPKLIVRDSKNGHISSPQGIGGDDRCGVFMILEIVKQVNCSVLFCEDEEIGGLGAKKFIQTDLAKGLEFNYAIEFDRRGKNDAVFYDCDNDEFEDFITKEFYKTAYGSFSDISVLAPFLKCAAVNISCGYYNAHTEQEYVVIQEMLASMNAAIRILERTTEADKFEYIEAVYSGYYHGYYGTTYGYNGYGGFGGYGYGYQGRQSSLRGFVGNYSSECDDDDDDDAEMYWVIEYLSGCGTTEWYDTTATSQAEAIGKFCMDFPNMCYGDIIDMMYEKLR